MKTLWCDNCEKTMPVRKGRCLKCKEKIDKRGAVFNVKSFLTALILLAMGCFLYLPYLAANQLGEGVRLRDSDKLNDMIDFVSVRRGIKEQVNNKMMNSLSTDKSLKDNPFSGFAMVLATSMVDRIVDVVMTPIGLGNLMKRGDLNLTELGDNSRPINPIDNARLAYDSLSKFSIWIPSDKGSETRIIMRREGITWRVVRIDLSMDDIETPSLKQPSLSNPNLKTEQAMDFSGDFRGSSWGDSKLDVKKSETFPVSDENNDSLVYKTSIGGVDVAALYQFLDDRLIQAAYISTESHFNKNDFIDDYNKLKQLLIKKYGDPFSDNILWKNDLYKDESSGWGTAISIGHLVYGAKWSVGNTEIMTGLSGDNFKITHIILYNDKSSEGKYKNKKDSMALDQL